MSVLIFLAVLFVLVLVHELGHFATAKWFGMRVDEFGIGFPPKLFGIKKGETEYTFNLFPIGGFVRIFGEDGDAKEPATAVAIPDPRSFTGKSKWAQSVVLLAGITMNILFAWLLVMIAYGVGVQGIVNPEDATPNARLIITQVLPGGPAELVKVEPGAVLKGVTAGDANLEDFTPAGFSTFVSTHTDEPLTIFYTYNGEPRMVQLESQSGVIAEDPDKRAIGVALSLVDTIERSPKEVVIDSGAYVLTGIRDIVTGLGGLLADAFRLEADFTQVAGPVGIVGLVGEASAYGITTLLMFTAFISLNLAVINVLPFPALDGGRLLFVIIEAIKGTPIQSRIAGILNTIGFVILLALMAAVTWNDIARLLA